MATTTNFGWETPDDTDLVKDGALAMRTLGSAIDTSFVDLKGGTTGQNLRKATNTDLDFTWAGDATNTVIDAEGDLLVGDSADTLQRLAIGTTGQVLTVDTAIDGKIKWAAAAGGGKVLQVVAATHSTQAISSSSTAADTGLTATITPTLATSKVLVLVNQAGCGKETGDTFLQLSLLRGATVISNFERGAANTGSSALNFVGSCSVSYLDSPATTSATTYKTQFLSGANTAKVYVNLTSGGTASMSTIVLLEIGA